jgi:hypothetical protein
MLCLLFIRKALNDQKTKTEQKSNNHLTTILVTPLGKFSGITESDVQLIQMPFVSEAGDVGLVPMKRLYLNVALSDMAKRINVDTKVLLDGSREFIIVADIDVKSISECCPCYSATTKSADNMDNIRRLESTVMHCLKNGLDSLPVTTKADWLATFITPLLNDVKVKMINKAH